MQRSCTEILPGQLLWRSCTETLQTVLSQGSCQEVSHLNFAKRTCQRAYTGNFNRDLLQSDIAQRAVGILPSGPYRDLAKRPRAIALVQRSCQDTSSGDLVQTHCIQICCKNLGKKSLTQSWSRGHSCKSLCRDLINRSCREISCRYLVQRSCQETS